MRKYTLMLVMAVFAALGFQTSTAFATSSNTNAMTVRFSFTASTQAPIDGVTNATSTNVTYKVGKFRFTNKDLLTLLAAEFGTVFPDGAQLGLTTSFQFVILDKGGNIFLNISTNLSDSSYVFNITNNSSGVVAGKVVEVADKATEVVNEVVPDFTFYYADGKGNHFHFGGLVTIRINAVVEGITTTFKTVSLTVVGSGGGTLFNPSDDKYDKVILTGPWIAAGANTAQK